MAQLGVQITAESPPTARFWLDTATNIADPAIFLVRAGNAPLWGRVCRISDLVNWPAVETEGFGWYRVAGIEIPLEHCEDYKRHYDFILEAVNDLDTSLGLEPESVQYMEALHVFRTGPTVFGELAITKTVYGMSAQLQLRLEWVLDEFRDITPENLFIITDNEFSRVLSFEDSQASALGSDETAVNTLTVWLPVDKVQDFISAVIDDIEDLVTYLAINERIV